MVLQATGIWTESLQSLHDMCPTQSVWTVDLAHLLRKFGLEVQYTTLTLGTNPGYAAEAFYGQMEEDTVRVERLFQLAAEAGIVMEQRCVPRQELASILLAGEHLVVALVDKDLHSLGLPLWRSPGHRAFAGFRGHYIVLCGYTSETDHFIVRDPDPRAAHLGLCSVRASMLDAARKAFGTDEDLLIIKLP